jgi:hypothetical protein
MTAGLKCGAQKRQGPGSCAKPAGWGTNHPGWGRCKLHGGSSPTGIRAAETARAKHAVVTFGLPIQVDALTALRCGLEERIARVTEAQGRLVGEAMQKMFADPELALTDKQRAALPAIVPRHLHAVSGAE